MASGYDHISFLDKEGRIFAMGDDTYGQCGNPDIIGSPSERRVRFPVQIHGLKRVTRLVCGGHHTIVIDENKCVFGWGSNSHLQLSHEH